MANTIICSNFTQLLNDGCTTELDPFDLTSVAGDDADDFDIDRANEEYYEECSAALEPIRPEWCLYRNGVVIGPMDSEGLSEDEVEELKHLIENIEVGEILYRHKISD